MSSFLSAHGFDPGPTQRPGRAGLLAGLAGTVPAGFILLAFGSLAAEARILHLPIAATLALGCGLMAAAGGIYGRAFGRGANDGRGGWLFGMAYGFLLWTFGAMMILPLLGGGEAPAGGAASGIVLSLLVWGTVMGGTFPHIHRTLQVGIDLVDERSLGEVGPAAAARRPANRGSGKRQAGG
jgi:hypothetical protein